MHDVGCRERKPRSVVAILNRYFSGQMNKHNFLNVSGSTSFIHDVLADYAGTVIGVALRLSNADPSSWTQYAHTL